MNVFSGLYRLTGGVLVLTVLASCSLSPTVQQGNAVYYWRTELRFSPVERQFLQQHDIQKMYCRYFDVVMDDPQAEPHPNATITFTDRVPEGIELVPTVYITEDCMHQRHDSLARQVVRRVMQMNATNKIGGVKELQIDCDYTARSRTNFYEFLKEVKGELSTLNSPLGRRTLATNGTQELSILSVTIRLHQLQMAPPPADYGVLMLYNTGDPRKFEERNPVLDLRDVQPYADHLAAYPLPLAAAYPVYRWLRQVHGVRIEHTVEADEILRVKQLVEQKRPSLKEAVIIYHLDEENINRYTLENYEAIFHH